MPASTSPEHLLEGRRRAAGPSERRCITRQDVGHQRALTVGVIYASPISNGNLELQHGQQPFIAVLRHCIERHPVLSTVIAGSDTEAPEFATPQTLDLSQHVQIRKNDEDFSEHSLIVQVLTEAGDQQLPLSLTTPPWRIVLTPLDARNGSASRLLVTFAYHHSHGDGKSGLAFHRFFLEGLKMLDSPDEVSGQEADHLCNPPQTALLPRMEDTSKLSVSWSYLLSPLLGAHLPTSIANLFGFRASFLPPGTNIWRGKIKSFNAANHRTGLKMVTVDYSDMRKVLRHCKLNKTTFTGLMNHLIARSLSLCLPPNSGDHSVHAFESQVAVDMRHLFNGVFTDDSMMNCVTGYNETLPRADKGSENWNHWPDSSCAVWAAARNTSESLVKSANTLHNQPMGLLAYLKDFRSWTLGHIGKERECSYEISNLVVFDPMRKDFSLQDTGSRISVEQTGFAQPATAESGCLNFNLVSTKAGPLAMTVTWQYGVLNLGDDQAESAFVQNVCSRIASHLQELVEAPM